MNDLKFKDIKVGTRVFCIREGTGGFYDTTIPTPSHSHYVITRVKQEYTNQFSVKLLSEDAKYYGRYINKCTINYFKLVTNNNNYEIY
jgi:hypothetical protein